MLKKILSLLMTLSLLGNTVPCFAISENSLAVEHLDINKKAPVNTVEITDQRKIVNKGNVLQFAFDERFFSKKANAGELVHFDVPEALYTREGSLILPAGSKVVAEITRIEKPKKFNKNARVSLAFRSIVLPDNTVIEINAQPFTKDNKLKEGPWTTTGKLVASTLTFGVVGAGAGVGFAFIPTPAKIGAGLAAGIPAGCGIGLLVGLLTPGCHYKAKKGETVYALLVDDFSVYNK